MKQILLFEDNNIAVVEGEKSVNKIANLKTSTSILINKKPPVKRIMATRGNIRRYIDKKDKGKNNKPNKR